MTTPKIDYSFQDKRDGMIAIFLNSDWTAPTLTIWLGYGQDYFGNASKYEERKPSVVVPVNGGDDYDHLIIIEGKDLEIVSPSTVRVRVDCNNKEEPQEVEKPLDDIIGRRHRFNPEPAFAGLVPGRYGVESLWKRMASLEARVAELEAAAKPKTVKRPVRKATKRTTSKTTKRTTSTRTRKR